MTEITETTLAAAPADYRAALAGAALVDEADAGRIFMRGRDRAALLHRLSTNDIERLRPGDGLRTVLTSPIGRIIDLLTVHALEDVLLLVTSAGQGPAVFGHLKRNIFFQDQVTLEPAGRTRGQLALYGPAAPRVLAQLGAPEAAGLAPGQVAQAEVAGVALLLAGRLPLGGAGYTLYPPLESVAAVRAALEAAGAAPLGAESLDALRLEQGYPAFGRELSLEYIPLETGLLDAVSFSKGCYVGQEIIARMESRGRMAKRLMGLRLRGASGGPADDGAAARLTLPAKLEVDGKDAGVLTSALVSPRLGPVALAYVRTAQAEAGTLVQVAGADLAGEVVELPFA